MSCIHGYENLKLFFHELICTFLYKIYSSNLQRDVENFTVRLRLKLNFFFFTVRICGCEYSITQYERKSIHQQCAVEKKPNIILKKLIISKE